ncbi:MAG: YCF48-related protein, partial [Thermoguttaceae bacterium]
MPASVAILLLATLPITQVPNVPAQGEPGPAKPNRRILAPEYGTPFSQSGDPPARQIQPDDARLGDVSFVDPQHGWAIGDHGVILHTDDGGQHWSPQVSGMTCTLTSVCFVDARNGWAAGGMAYPYLHDSSGVVLSTRDGGLNWLREPVLLPALRKIRFITQRQGWAIGCPSAMFPGGAFITRDAGRSWQPACSGGASRLLTGDFFDGRNALLGGSLGLMAAISEGDFFRNPHSDLILPGINGMQAVPPGYGWLVGDGGWIALTGNRGNSWRPPLGTLPPETALFDFSALTVRGPKCWIAGSPGSRVFFTPDAGRTWAAYPTGTTLPLRAITFIDDQHGWAVGQLGLILASNDGGRTWRRQRSGGARAAVMA